MQGTTDFAAAQKAFESDEVQSFLALRNYPTTKEVLRWTKEGHPKSVVAEKYQKFCSDRYDLLVKHHNTI